MIKNPLALHISGPNGRRDGLGNWLAQLTAAGCPAPVLYSVNVNLSDDLRKYSPETRLIFRLQNETFERLPGNFFEGDPRAGARHWLTGLKDNSGRTQVQTWALNPAHWYDPLNEPVPGTVAQAQWLNEWMLEALTIAHERGLKLALFSFATGSPDYPLWQHLIPALQLGQMNGAILSLHAYNDGGLTERNANGTLTQAAIHNSFRHWQIYESIPESARLPVVYSEASMGNGYGMQPDDVWLADLIDYGQVLKEDPYALSACAFQCGGSESNCYRILPAYSQAIVDADWIITPEPPAPDDWFPFVVVSHLVPQDTTDDEYNIVQAEARPARQDVLFSADIAKANALHGKPGSKVIVWQPDRWQDSITDYLAPATVETREFQPPVIDPFWVSWPVGGGEAVRITDPFNTPRNYANGEHEGIDGDAYLNALGRNAPILAAQDGIVEMVRARSDVPSYGMHVVIRHPWGGTTDRYRTLYAHLSSIIVSQGQTVRRGQQIGVAGATGTQAIHLHFGVYDTVAGLKGYVHCADCSALWPDGVLDPESVMVLEPIYNTAAWRGLHMRADGNSQTADFECLRVAKLDAAKIMTNTGFDELHDLISAGVDPGRIVLRLFADFSDRVITPSEFYGWQRAWLGEFTRAGGQYVEIHNEPNLPQEGLGTSWATAEAWGGWYEGVVRLIRTEFPAVLAGWPGLSPQPNVPNFIMVLQACIRMGFVDWVGAHSYWQSSAEMDSLNAGRYYRGFLGVGKPVIITEFSNIGAINSDAAKGEQYKQYYATLETDVLGAFSFVSSASDTTFNLRRETWARNGQITDIPRAVGA